MPAAQKSSPEAPKKALRVRATRLGYYDHKRRREGDVFTLRPVVGKKLEKTTPGGVGKLVPHTFTVEEQFSEYWMEVVASSTPEHTTSAPEDLRRKHEEILQARRPGDDVNPDPLGASQ
jgi:hypothetical protein